MIYEFIDKMNFGRNYLLVEKDLRKQLDLLPIDNIPVSENLMLNCNTRTSRLRTPEDIITYELPYPSLTYQKVFTWFQSLCPLSFDSLRSHLKLFLCGKGPSNISVYGDGVDCLFNALLMLSPLVSIGSRRLFTEIYISKRLLEDVSHSRIVLSDLEDRTFRPAKLDYFNEINFPIQYHGILKIRNISQIPPSHRQNIPIYCLSNNLPIIFSPEELLGWIIWN